MDRACRNYDGKKVCPKCGVVVSNLRKHKARNRCKAQHVRGWKKISMKLAKQGRLFF